MPFQLIISNACQLGLGLAGCVCWPCIASFAWCILTVILCKLAACLLRCVTLVCFGVLALHQGCIASLAAMCCCTLLLWLLNLQGYRNPRPPPVLTLSCCAGSALWKSFCILKTAVQICLNGDRDWQSTMQGRQTLNECSQQYDQNECFLASMTPAYDALAGQHCCATDH